MLQDHTRAVAVAALLLFLTIGLPTALHAQQPETGVGRVAGQIVDHDGVPLAHIVVRIEGSPASARTGATGRYVVADVPAGTQTVVAAGLAFQTSGVEVVIVAGETTYLDLRLDRHTFFLERIDVVAQRTQYADNVSSFGARFPVAIGDLPQSINIVTRQVLDDQQAVRVQDAFRDVSGVSHGRNATNEFVVRGFNDNGTVTGFSIAGSIFQINGLRNYFGEYTADVSLDNIERVEVLKGSSGVLYGFNQPGGVLNLVTKKPLETPLWSVAVSAGSWGRYRVSADMTGPLTADERLLYRFNLGFGSSPDYRDVFFNRNVVVAPSLAYRIGDRTSIGVDLLYSRGKRSAWYDWGIPTRDEDGTEIAERVSMQYTHAQQGDFAELTSYGALVDVQHRFSDAVSWTTGVSVSGNDIVTEGHYPQFARAVPTAEGDVGLQFRFFDAERSGIFLTNHVTARGATGVVRHRVVAGLDIFAGSGTGREITAANTAELPDNVQPQNVYAPDFSRRLSGNYVFTGGFGTPQSVQFMGVYVQDLIEVGDALKALVGLRYDRHRSVQDVGGDATENNPLLPNLGVVLSPARPLSLYASYTTGFLPQMTQDPAVGGPFDPLHSRQLEAGIKADWLDGRLTTTTSVYQIRRVNELIQANDPANPQRLTQAGETRSEGVEVDVAGSVTPGWNVVANYAYNFARVSESDDASVIGVDLPNAPRHLARLWSRLNLGEVQNVGIATAAGVSHSGSRLGAFDGTRYPGYTTLDGALYLRLPGFSVAVNGYNLLGRSYIAGVWADFYAQRGMPRNFMVRAEFGL